MKTRHGLVSNSSSSSFCIYGTQLEGNKIEKLKKFLSIEEDACYSELAETFNYGEATKNIGVELTAAFSGESLYIGRSWSGVKDDETGKQFKDSIEKIIESIFGEKIKCRTHEEAWYNG